MNMNMVTTRGVMGQCPPDYTLRPFPIFFNSKFFIDLGTYYFTSVIYPKNLQQLDWHYPKVLYIRSVNYLYNFDGEYFGAHGYRSSNFQSSAKS